MKTLNFYTCLSAGVAAVALSGCGKSEPSSSSGAFAPAAQLNTAVAMAATATAAPADGNTYREQGTMSVDVGKGAQQLRSMATIIDPKLGEKTAARLGTAAGQKKLADATAGGVQVTSGDIQETADQFAGRTVYSSQVMHLEIIQGYAFELDAKSPSLPGVRMKVSFTVSDKDLSLQSAKLAYYPDASKQMQSYDSKKLPLTDFKLDKLERKDDKTFAVSGSFTATDIPPGVLAKELKGQTLASVSGRFDFSEVAIRKSGL